MRGVCIWIVCLLLTMGKAQGQSVFMPEPLAQYDGKAWGGIVLNEVSPAAAKRRFRTETSPTAQAAFAFADAPSPLFHIDAITSGRDKSEVIVGFWLRFIAPLSKQSELLANIADAPITFYSPERCTDWRVVALPERGIALFVQTEFERPVVAFALLTSPQRCKRMLDWLTRNPTPISAVADLPTPVVDYGTFTYSIGDDVTAAKHRADLEQFVRDCLREIPNQATLRFQDGTRGRLNAWIYRTSSQAYDENGMLMHIIDNYHAEVELNTPTLRGRIKARAEKRSIQETLTVELSGKRVRRPSAYSLLKRALETVAKSAKQQVQKQKPTSAADHTRRVREALLDSVRE